LINNNQEVLLQKRALGKTYPGLWDLSCGGHIPAGNVSLYTAVREIEEELGIDVKPEHLKFLGHYNYSHSEEGFIDNSFYDVYLARANYPITAFKIQIEEVAEVKYFKISELIDFMKNKPDEIIMADEELENRQTAVFYFYEISLIRRMRRSIASNGLSKNVCVHKNATSISISSALNVKTFTSSWNLSSRACDGLSQRVARMWR
jgi:8-oxo-dGTP pyrophosphatase MutT (NUDIX family)